MARQHQRQFHPHRVHHTRAVIGLHTGAEGRAHHRPGLRHRGRRLRGQALLPHRTAARIHAALRRRAVPERPEPAVPHVVGELSVDFAQRRATLAGRPVRLTSLEYRLLLELRALRRGGGDPRAPAGTDLGSGQLRRPAAGAHRREEPAPEAGRGRRQPQLRLHRTWRRLPTSQGREPGTGDGVTAAALRLAAAPVSPSIIRASGDQAKSPAPAPAADVAERLHPPPQCPILGLSTRETTSPGRPR